MQRNSLYTLVLSLNRQQKGELKKFASSPYHNTREEINRLLEYLDQKQLNFSKVEAFQYSYPKEKYDEKKMRYLLSDTLKVVERYLVVSKALEDPVQKEISLSQVYQQLNLQKAFDKKIRKARQLLDRRSSININHHEQSYLLEFEQYSFAVKKDRDRPINLQALNDTMDMAYLTKKLRLSCLSLAHQAVYKVDYDKGLLSAVIQHIERSPFLKDPLIALYYYYFKAATNLQVEKYYERFRTILLKEGDQIAEKEIRSLYALAINYGIRRVNTGDEYFLRQVFELYGVALEKKVFLTDGKFSRFAFKNIAAIGLRLTEYQWVESFIEKYGPSLDLRYRSNYVDYNLSKLWYAQQKYEQAMKLLRWVEYDDLFLNLDAKVLLIKIYYEQGEYDVLYSLLVSFKKFVQRKKMITYHKENYLNIISITQKLLEINPYDKEDKKKLKDKIQQTKALGERDWLLAQLNLL